MQGKNDTLSTTLRTAGLVKMQMRFWIESVSKDNATLILAQRKFRTF
jgi:hypothetical protein